MMPETNKYAYLPEDLLLQILEKTPETASKLAESIQLSKQQTSEARGVLENKNLIKKCPEGNHSESVMAADGACIIDHKTSSDILLAIAVGVDGLSSKEASSWPDGQRQYQHWQAVLPHHVANSRLAQGIMFLMELSILAGNDREIRIMDGSHLTTILKLNSLLSANDQDAADQPYVNALSNFLNENYEKVIPDIPNIIRDAFSNDSVIGLTKYSSSREIIDSKLDNLGIDMDDKVFMSILLKENEYTTPLPVGQCDKERSMWEKIHIRCNLNIEGVSNSTEFNPQLEEAIKPFKITKDSKSTLHFCYFKPENYTSALRIEIKRELANDQTRLERMFRSISNQIISTDIREPYPQYLADIMAKNIHFGMDAINQGVFNNPILNSRENFSLIFPYRT